MLNDVKAAIQVVVSDVIVLEVTPKVLQSLRPKYPPEPEDSLAPIIPADNITVSTDHNKIMPYLQSFSGGCINGLRPTHLLDLVADSTAEVGLHLHLSLDLLMLSFNGFHII